MACCALRAGPGGLGRGEHCEDRRGAMTQELYTIHTSHVRVRARARVCVSTNRLINSHYKNKKKKKGYCGFSQFKLLTQKRLATAPVVAGPGDESTDCREAAKRRQAVGAQLKCSACTTYEHTAGDERAAPRESAKKSLAARQSRDGRGAQEGEARA